MGLTANNNDNPFHVLMAVAIGMAILFSVLILSVNG